MQAASGVNSLTTGRWSGGSRISAEACWVSVYAEASSRAGCIVTDRTALDEAAKTLAG